jgi:hypothetical protein
MTIDMSQKSIIVFIYHSHKLLNLIYVTEFKYIFNFLSSVYFFTFSSSVPTLTTFS